MGKPNKLNFKGTMLRERSVAYSAVPFVWHAQKHGPIMTEKRSVSSWHREKG